MTTRRTPTSPAPAATGEGLIIQAVSLLELLDRFSQTFPYRAATCTGGCHGHGYIGTLDAPCAQCARGRAWAEELRKLHIARVLGLSTPFKPIDTREPKTFDNFNTDVHEDHWMPLHALRARVSGEWAEDEPGNVLLWGYAGRGKTHLVQAAYAELCRLNVPALFIVWEDFLGRQRAGYEQQDGSGRELLDAAKAVDVLILDDIALFYQPETRRLRNEYDVTWAGQLLYDLLNARITAGASAGLRTFITSNRAPEDPSAPSDLLRIYGAPVVSRLTGHFLSFQLGGPDMRQWLRPMTAASYKNRYGAERNTSPASSSTSG